MEFQHSKTKKAMNKDISLQNQQNKLNTALSANEEKQLDGLIKAALTHKKKLNSQDIEDLIRIKAEKDKRFKQRKILFTAIGYTISLLMVIAAFEWKFYDEKEVIDLTYSGEKFEELAEIPLTEQAPPPPPSSQTVQVIFTEVPDEEIIEEIKVDLDVEVTSEMVVKDQIVNPFEFEPEEEVAEEVFTIVEQYPEPVGGYASFYQFIGENLFYPGAARRLAIEGKVFVKFIVEPQGNISGVEIVKGIDPSCDQAALEVIQKSPDWIPGKQRGRPVRVRMIVPIIFKLDR